MQTLYMTDKPDFTGGLYFKDYKLFVKSIFITKLKLSNSVLLRIPVIKPFETEMLWCQYLLLS